MSESETTSHAKLKCPCCGEDIAIKVEVLDEEIQLTFSKDEDEDSKTD